MDSFLSKPIAMAGSICLVVGSTQGSPLFKSIYPHKKIRLLTFFAMIHCIPPTSFRRVSAEGRHASFPTPSLVRAGVHMSRDLLRNAKTQQAHTATQQHRARKKQSRAGRGGGGGEGGQGRSVWLWARGRPLSVGKQYASTRCHHRPTAAAAAGTAPTMYPLSISIIDDDAAATQGRVSAGNSFQWGEDIPRWVGMCKWCTRSARAVGYRLWLSFPRYSSVL